MSICREWTLVKSQGSIAQAEPLRCRSWGCEICAPDRRKRLIAQAIGGLPNTFITLTCRPKIGESPTDRARLLVKSWRTARKHFRGRHDCEGRVVDNGTLPFFAVFERTKKGEPHLHILARSQWIDQDELSKLMEKLNGAPVVWIERITDPARTASYVAKYCGKDPQKFDTLKRYWTSQDYELDPPLEHEDDPANPVTFEVVKCSVNDWVNNRASEGWMAWTTAEGATAWNPRHQGPAKQLSDMGRVGLAARGPP